MVRHLEPGRRRRSGASRRSRRRGFGVRGAGLPAGPGRHRGGCRELRREFSALQQDLGCGQPRPARRGRCGRPHGHGHRGGPGRPADRPGREGRGLPPRRLREPTTARPGEPLLGRRRGGPPTRAHRVRVQVRRAHAVRTRERGALRRARPAPPDARGRLGAVGPLGPRPPRPARDVVGLRRPGGHDPGAGRREDPPAPLGLEWNFPTNNPRRIPARPPEPAALHYKDNVSAEGLLGPSGSPVVDRRIALANEAIAEVWSEVFPPGT